MQGGRPTYRPERPKGAKDEVKRPFLPILHCTGAKPASAKPAAASKAEYSRPRQTIADQGRPWQTKAFWNPRCYQHLWCLYWTTYTLYSLIQEQFKRFVTPYTPLFAWSMWTWNRVPLDKPARLIIRLVLDLLLIKLIQYICKYQILSPWPPHRRQEQKDQNLISPC